MIDDLRALAIFAETVKQGSFRGAAKKLELSPSVVSYHIAQLEKRLETPLLYRSTRKISLTHDGEILLKHANDMVEIASQGINRVLSSEGALSGKLTITIPSGLTRSPLNRKIAEFSKTHPGIDLHLIYTDIRQDLIANGIDLAVRAGGLEDSALKSKRIGKVIRKLVCTADYYAQHSTPRHPKDLCSWNWIKLEMLPSDRTLIHGMKKKYSISYTSTLTVDSVEAMTQHCMYGLGVATPPDFLVDDAIKQSKLVHILPEWRVEDMPLTALWPANTQSNKNTKILLNYLCD